MNITLTRERQRVGLTQRELARLTGVATSTVSRIESGDMDPAIGMLNRLLEATGSRAELVTATSDPLAIAAVRAIIEGRTDERAQPWVDRFARLGWLVADGEPVSARRLCERGARFSDLRRRPGARTYRNDITVEQFTGGSTAAGVGIVFTCGIAMERLGISDTAGWNVAYVSDLDAAESALGLKPYGRLEGAPLFLLPFDGLSESGAVDDCAAPLQVLLDCYSGPGRMTEMADILADRWDSQ